VGKKKRRKGYHLALDKLDGLTREELEKLVAVLGEQTTYLIKGGIPCPKTCGSLKNDTIRCWNNTFPDRVARAAELLEQYPERPVRAEEDNPKATLMSQQKKSEKPPSRSMLSARANTFVSGCTRQLTRSTG